MGAREDACFMVGNVLIMWMPAAAVGGNDDRTCTPVGGGLVGPSFGLSHKSTSEVCQGPCAPINFLQ
jgi:hypothetical protein